MLHVQAGEERCALTRVVTDTDVAEQGKALLKTPFCSSLTQAGVAHYANAMASYGSKWSFKPLGRSELAMRINERTRIADES